MPFPQYDYLGEEEERLLAMLQEMSDRLPSASRGESSGWGFEETSQDSWDRMEARRQEITATIAPMLMFGKPGAKAIGNIINQVGDGIRRVQFSGPTVRAASQVLWPRRLRHGMDPKRVDSVAKSFGAAEASISGLMDLLFDMEQQSGGR